MGNPVRIFILKEEDTMSSKTKSSPAQRLVVSAMLIAIATVLSLLKIVDLPYGGSVTLASMFPLVLIAYRYGTAWGLLSSLVYGAIQLALGADNLSYVSGALSVIMVVLFDYIIAFGLIGLAGLARTEKNSQPMALVIGVIMAAVFRYICHVISGATVWAGLSIPTAAALSFSMIYNATYMLPEMLVLIVVAYYLGTTLDFGSEKLKALSKPETTSVQRLLTAIAGLLLAGALVFDVAAVFGKLQNGETGEFDITGIANAPWLWIVIVTVLCAAVAAALLVIRKKFAAEEKTDK